MAFCLKFLARAVCWPLVLLALAAPFSSARGDSNLLVRVMAANLNGNSQTYETFALRIFQGLKPDVVAIQEFNYLGNTATDVRNLVDTAFGTNFHYYRESGYQIPNGIISRYPILDSGSWADSEVGNRAFAWVLLDLPGTNDLYVVSVHLLSSSSTSRAREATSLKTLIQTQFPPNAWVILAGDMNTDSRGESAITTFKTFLSDSPVPTDAVSGGSPNTNAGRNKPYDYVFPSFSLAAWQTNTDLPSVSFPGGLVFDSRVYQPLSDVAPIQYADSGNAQHMAILKDFRLPIQGTNVGLRPVITNPPVSVEVALGQDAGFSVGAAGQEPLAFQWYHEGAVLVSATNSLYTRTNVQAVQLGGYQVVVTNIFGAVTSSAVQLTLVSAPAITNQPANLSVEAGRTAFFTVGASGSRPLTYQWFFQGALLADATTSLLTRASVQTVHEGEYQVVVTNVSGRATSDVARLTVLPAQPGQRGVIARWSFNNTNAPLASPPPDLGTGTAALIGGTTALFASGSANDTNGTNQAWNTSAYPVQGTGNRTAGVQFQVSTAGRRNIEVRWDNRASSTGTKYVRFLWSTNGTIFQQALGAFTNSTSFEARTNNLAGWPSVDNNSNFVFRIVAEFESTATEQGTAAYLGASSGYGQPGTLRFDMVTVSGDALVSPPATPEMKNPRATGNGLAFEVNGTPGALQVVEMSPGIAPPQWQPVMTNIAPFVFVQTNLAAAGFYRVRAQPQ